MSVKTAGGIRVRKVHFEFPEDFRPDWNPSKPVFSQLANGASILLPSMEPFIIHAIREATREIKDPALLDEARAWMAQEAHHFRQHQRYNDALCDAGYPVVREREVEIESEYEAYRKRSLKFKVAYTAGFEVMALSIAHTLIRDRAYFFQGAVPSVASMWIWHLVEEIEHKNLAHDVYRHLYGGHLYRAYGVFAALIHMIGMIRSSYIALLRADGVWGGWKTRWAIKKHAFRLMTSFLPRTIRYALPGHHPSKVEDPAWMKEWVELFDRGETGLLCLDMTQARRFPAEMIPSV